MSEAILLRVKLKSNTVQFFVRQLPWIRSHLPESAILTIGLRRLFETILQIEDLYTESLFLDRRENGDQVFWYMEAEDISQFYDYFERALDANSLLAIIAKRIIHHSIENPEKALTYSEDSSELELFLHGTNPTRS